MTRIELRAARVEDVTLVARVGVESYRDHYADLWSPAGLDGWLAEQFGAERLARELADGSGVAYTLAIDDGGRAVGFAKTAHAQPVPGRAELRGRELQKNLSAARDGWPRPRHASVGAARE